LDASDVDNFAVTVPSNVASVGSLFVAVCGTGDTLLSPNVRLLDGTGRVLDFELLARDGSNFVARVNGLQAGQKLFVEVGAEGTGSYVLFLNSRGADTFVAPALSVGSLASSNSTQSFQFQLAQSGFTHFVLSAQGSSTATGSLTMTIRDSRNKVVATLTTDVNDGRSLELFLEAGTYSIEMSRSAGSDPIDYQLLGWISTDPVGMKSTTTTTTTDSGSTSGGGTYTGSSKTTGKTTY
jgi:hypothetical protein